MSTVTPTYPPTNDDVAETRRIEENLRRWDVAERQRRKSARESVQPTSSLVNNLSRTASLLWSEKRPRYKHDINLGNHVALQSQENINSVSIDDLNATPTPSPSPSPTPSQDSDPQNPFTNTSEPLSPFTDPFPNLSITEMNCTSSSSGLQGNRSPARRVPPGPPMPLDLPPPRTPPPIHPEKIHEKRCGGMNGYVDVVKVRKEEVIISQVAQIHLSSFVYLLKCCLP
ncbi:hypothetical protein J132_05570 [Termitomyces sp. J132]|nr:hypothetical protein J132_05570 [Termitomyces sp. J132]